VLITGYLDEDQFFRHIAAADCLVNLRYPSVGESSGTLTRALALGLPAIVYNFGPFAEIPNDVVIKVPLELGEPLALAAALDMLMHDPVQRQTLGEAARQHMRSHHSVQRSAGLYLDLVQSLSRAAA
jgi:glycosyltransferase involved in cell wall biosynthesis